MPSLAELTERLARGELQLHRFPLGFLITEIKEVPGERVLLVQLISGERLDEWKDEAHRVLCDFARANGCTAIEATCRLGLEQKLKPLGWKKTRVVLRSNLI